MITIDLETFNRVHDVRKVGAHKYAENAEILICCFAIDDGQVYRLDWTGEVIDTEEYDLLASAWRHHRKCAHHAAFERCVLNRWGFPSQPEDWDDTAVLALTVGLPAKMSTLCSVLGLTTAEGKDKRGQQLINRFCSPAPANHRADRYTRDTHPGEWAEFSDYCAQDVEVCRRLWTLLPHWVYDMERANWLLDQHINDRGLPIDSAFCSSAINAINRSVNLLHDELRRITQGQVPLATEVLALRTWVMAQGVATDSVDKASIEALLDDPDLPPNVRRALEIRQQAGRASVAKYVSAWSNATKGRLYGALQFYGANRTGRWAGRQLQPQNMARPKLKGREMDQARLALLRDVADVLFADPIDVAASCVRSVICAPPGKQLISSDLANIEGRMLAWLAGEAWKLEAFRAYDAGTGPDLYKLAYARAFDLSVDRIKDDERQIGKVMELALGYQGGVGAFATMAKTYGVDLPESTIVDLVARWRENHPCVRRLWREVEDAAIIATRNRGKTYRVRDLRFRTGTDANERWTWLLIKLPNGRLLCYFDPQLEDYESPRFGPQTKLSYTGQVVGGHWSRIATYGGKLVENITQACARDVMAEGMQRAEAAGYPVILTVHDEVVTECPESGDYTPEALSALLARVPTWAPELPLAAAGYASRYYRKG